MKAMKVFGSLIDFTCEMLNNDIFKAGACMRKEDFSRNRKMNFADMCLVILRGQKKSLQANLNNALQEAHHKNKVYSKQAFSKGRQRIKPEAFKQLFDEVTEHFYQVADIEKYKGYRITAIDGTKYNLPNTPELLGIYGTEPYSNATIQVQALGSCLYDVLNGMIMDVQLFPHNANEREIAKIHIDNFSRYDKGKELVIMDRGYPSADLIHHMETSNVKYLMRCSTEFIKTMDFTKEDKIITHKFSKTIDGKPFAATFRALAIKINDTVTEYLITNILDDEFSVNDFKYLYHLRWNIETKYDDLKSKMQIENFSGNNNIAVLQDYYATMYLSNMVSAAEFDCKDGIKSKYSTEELKHKYKLNTSMTISTLKTQFISLFMLESSRQRAREYKRLMATLTASVVSVRPGRSFPRKQSSGSNRFSNNRRTL